MSKSAETNCTEGLVALLIAAASLIAFQPTANAAAPTVKTYKAASWEAAFDTVPCDAFKRNADGSWSETGRILAGNTVMAGRTFRHSREALALDRRCAAKRKRDE